MTNEKRLIDANALLRRLQKRREDLASAWRTFDAMPIDAQIQYHENLECSLIAEDCPIVDAVEVVHGRWVDEFDGKYANPKYICSHCTLKALYKKKLDVLGSWQTVQALTDYCPNCGAKMDGDGNEID